MTLLIKILLALVLVLALATAVTGNVVVGIAILLIGAATVRMFGGSLFNNRS